MTKRCFVLLRGVTPNGKSKIKDMTYLAQVLEEAGFRKVKVYLQTGNIILETSLDDREVKALVEKTIYEKFDADISAIVKSYKELTGALEEYPFSPEEKDDVRLLFTNDITEEKYIASLLAAVPDDEKVAVGNYCLYIYVPKVPGRRNLNNNFMERKLRIISTVRKISVIEKLVSL